MEIISKMGHFQGGSRVVFGLDQFKLRGSVRFEFRLLSFYLLVVVVPFLARNKSIYTFLLHVTSIYADLPLRPSIN